MSAIQEQHQSLSVPSQRRAESKTKLITAETLPQSPLVRQYERVDKRRTRAKKSNPLQKKKEEYFNIKTMNERGLRLFSLYDYTEEKTADYQIIVTKCPDQDSSINRSLNRQKSLKRQYATEVQFFEPKEEKKKQPFQITSRYSPWRKSLFLFGFPLLLVAGSIAYFYE